MFCSCDHAAVGGVYWSGLIGAISNCHVCVQSGLHEWEEILTTLDAKTANHVQQSDGEDDRDDSKAYLMEEAGHAIRRLISTTYAGNNVKKTRETLLAEHSAFFE